FLGQSRLNKKYENEFIFLTVGNLIKTKGHDLTLKAFKEILDKKEDARLLIIGDGSEKNNLLTLANNLGIKEKVNFLGTKSHEEVMEYISICDVFVLPSWSEALGVVYLEA